MRTVEIVMTAADPEETRAWGEVKGLDEPGMPTIAHVEARMTYSDVFHARPGRHVLQFRVDRESRIALAMSIDDSAGTPVQFDCTEITAGRRFVFEVPQ